MSPGGALVGVAFALLLAHPARLAAQHDPVVSAPPATREADVARRVSGQVVRATTGGDLPVADTWVTLHRIARTDAGPVDSARTDRDGRYVFRYAISTADTSTALFIASARYAGIAYFSAPLQDADASGDAALITVFDTASSGVALRVRGRHLIVSGADAEGRRTIFEVFEISNDTTVTRIAGDTSSPVFTTQLPDGATDPTVAQGDIAAGAVTFGDGRVDVFAPIAPGLRQLSYSYSLPGSAFPLGVPILEGIDTFEVLIEDPDGQVTGAGLAEQDAVSVEGRRFRRFLARDVTANAVAQVDVPAAAPASGDRRVLVLVAALAIVMIVALTFALKRRAS